jgi:hypothetical protein
MSALLITATGFLAADPKGEIKMETVNGQERVSFSSWARFRVLHNPYGKDKDKNPYAPVGVDFVCFGRNAQVAMNFLKSGSCPTVFGHVKSNALAIGKDGQPIKTKDGRYIVNMECEVIPDGISLGAKTGDSTTSSASTETSSIAASSGDLAHAPF